MNATTPILVALVTMLALPAFAAADVDVPECVGTGSCQLPDLCTLTTGPCTIPPTECVTNPTAACDLL